MRVMLWPQPSMRNYRTGFWHLEMDPNINKDRAWVRMTPQWEWAWLVPTGHMLSPESRKGIPEGVRRFPKSWGPNVQAERANFPWDEVCRYIDGWKPDIMILENPEHAKGIRMVQEWLRREFPIVSYVNYATHYRYTEKPEKNDTWPHQLEGAMVSDRLVFNTEGIRDGFLQRAEDELYGGYLGPLENNVSIWPGVYSPREIDEYALSPADDPPAVNFISRLSDPAKNHHPEFAEALQRVKRAGIEFQTWVGNPNRSMTEQEIMELFPNVTKIGYSSREEYLESMNRAAVVPCLWAQDQIYSIGYCDALAGSAVTIAATTGAEVGGLNFREGGSVKELTGTIVEALSIASDPEIWASQQAEERMWLMEKRSVEMNIGTMVEDMEALVGVH